jgi:hypothetical protein
MTKLACCSVPLALLLMAFGPGCGGSSGDSGSGGGGGSGATGGSTNVTAAATTACQKKIAAGCPNDDKCVPNYQKDQGIAELFGCGAEQAAYLDCLGGDGWKCDTLAGGGYSYEEPKQCSDLFWAANDCQGGYSFMGGGGKTCSGDLTFDGQSIGGSCSGDLAACKCSSGPKQDTTFSVKSCDELDFFTAVAASCR